VLLFYLHNVLASIAASGFAQTMGKASQQHVFNIKAIKGHIGLSLGLCPWAYVPETDIVALPGKPLYWLVANFCLQQASFPFFYVDTQSEHAVLNQFPGYLPLLLIGRINVGVHKHEEQWRQEQCS
jgi:hypothetical protein